MSFGSGVTELGAIQTFNVFAILINFVACRPLGRGRVDNACNFVYKSNNRINRMMKAIRLHLTGNAPHLTAVRLADVEHGRVGTEEVHEVRVGTIALRRRPVARTQSKHALAFVFLKYCVGCLITSRSSAQNSMPFIGAGHIPTTRTHRR